MPSQPAANPRGFVRTVVVQDEVGLEAGGHRHLDLIQELAELDGPMVTMVTCPALDVERGEQRGGAVAHIIMRPPRHRI